MLRAKMGHLALPIVPRKFLNFDLLRSWTTCKCCLEAMLGWNMKAFFRCWQHPGHPKGSQAQIHLVHLLRRQSTHLRLQNFLTCASYSLAPPSLTCASDLSNYRLQYSLAPPQCFVWIVSLSLHVHPLCLPPCDHMKSKSLLTLSPPLPSTMRPSEI